MTRMIASTKDPAPLAGYRDLSGAGIAIRPSLRASLGFSCDAFGETGKGFGQYLTVVGLCETVAIFVMAFTFGAI